MNCAIPCAPAGLTANGLKLLSAYSWEAIRFAETFQRWAAAAIAPAYRAGTKPGTAGWPATLFARAPSASSPPAERALRV